MSCAPDLPQSDGGLPFGLSSRERAAVILNFFPFARLTRCVGRAVFFAAENLKIEKCFCLRPPGGLLRASFEFLQEIF